MDNRQDKLFFFIIIKKGLNTKLLVIFLYCSSIDISCHNIGCILTTSLVVMLVNIMASVIICSMLYTGFKPCVLCHNLQKIPPQFLKHFNKNLSSNAILIGPSGDQWQVAIFKKGNDIYLLKGWSQFLTDNSVKFDEFLLFTYHGENFFQVQIFGKNGCERLYLKETRQEARRKKGRPTKTSFGSVYLHQSKSSQEDLPFSNKGSLYKEFPKPQIPIKIERSEAGKSVESFTSSKPYFKHLLTKCNVEERCLLPVATKFARKYISEEVKKVILWNSEGKYWEVTVIWIHSHSHDRSAVSLFSFIGRATNGGVVGVYLFLEMVFKNHCLTQKAEKSGDWRIGSDGK
ncbi:hypothetical protein VNO77_36192 [Canavalia gladiata]|uniref:TF-B3 domain-containing protein n=1 Tax=Canavalia gladiata TaxID=3824 RepID=A0AAN9K8Z4_CANGL